MPNVYRELPWRSENDTTAMSYATEVRRDQANLVITTNASHGDFEMLKPTDEQIGNNVAGRLRSTSYPTVMTLFYLLSVHLSVVRLAIQPQFPSVPVDPQNHLGRRLRSYE